MSNSYIIELERLRVQLRDILRGAGFVVADDATLQTLIPMVNNIGYNNETELGVVNNYSVIGGMVANQSFEINDTLGVIKTLNPSNFRSLFSNKKITKLKLNGCVTITGNDGSVLTDCSLLTEIDLPELTSIDNSSWTFQDNTALTRVNIPKLTRFNSGFLRRCTALQSITLGENFTYMNDENFRGCTSLNEVTIKYTDGIVTMYNTNSFQSTPFTTAGQTATLYVPQTITVNGETVDGVTAYTNDTKWSTLLTEGTTFVASSE